jgi:hypothetical protein
MTRPTDRHRAGYLYVAVALSIGLLGKSPCSAQDNAALMRFIADGYETNLEKLRTWKGTAVVEGSALSYQKVEGTAFTGLQEEWKKEVRFVADRDRDAALWYGKYVQYSEGGTPKNKTQDMESGMNRGQYSYAMDFYSEQRLEKVPRAMRLYSREQIPHGFQLNEFDPVSMLTEDVGAHGQRAGQLKIWADEVEDPEIQRIFKLTRQGDIVTVFICAPRDDGTIDPKYGSRYVYDLSKGCAMTECWHTAPGMENGWQVDYEEHGGVFVPAAMTLFIQNAQIKHRHHAVITTEMVNEPVPESEFGYEAMGLRPGDRITDHVKGGLTYQWRLPPTEKDAPDVAVDDGPSSDEKEPSLAKQNSEASGKHATQSVSKPAGDSDGNKRTHKDGQRGLPVLPLILGISAIVGFGVLLAKRMYTRPSKEGRP